MIPSTSRRRRWPTGVWPVALLALAHCGPEPESERPAETALAAHLARSGLTAKPLPAPPYDYNFAHPPAMPCGQREVDLSHRVALTPAQERRALDLYEESLVILAHSHCVEPWDFAEMQRAGITAAILKVEVDGIHVVNGDRHYNLAGEDWVPRATRAIDRVRDIAARPDSKILIVRGVEDLRRAKREGKVGIIFSFEGGKPLLGELRNLNYYYELGLRELQLWWGTPNELMTGAGDQLSEFGAEVIRESNRLGILVDLSHMNGPAFARAVALSRAPVIVSHGSVAALHGAAGEDATQGQAPSGTDRLNDAAIRAIADNGGVICLHFATPYYIVPRHGTPQATVEDLVDHMAYIRDLVGIDHVALGPDFLPEDWRWIAGAARMSLLPNVAREMVRQGFADEEIRKVLGGNLLRVFAATWAGVTP